MSMVIGDIEISISCRNNDFTKTVIWSIDDILDKMYEHPTQLALPMDSKKQSYSHALNILFLAIQNFPAKFLFEEEFDILLEPASSGAMRGPKLFLGFVGEDAYLMDERGELNLPLGTKGSLTLTDFPVVERAFVSLGLDGYPASGGLEAKTVKLQRLYDKYTELSQDPFSFPEDFRDAVDSGFLVTFSDDPIPKSVTKDISKHMDFIVRKGKSFSWNPFLERA